MVNLRGDNCNKFITPTLFYIQSTDKSKEDEQEPDVLRHTPHKIL